MKSLSARGAKGKVFAVLAALLCIVLIYGVICHVTGVSPAKYGYKSYLYQAQSWLEGKTTVDGERLTHLELAIYDGEYYVSFPPVPSVPMLLYTQIWGDDVPGGLFQKIYVGIACMLMLCELLRRRKMPWQHAAAWALFFCFGSALLPVTLVGSVWYEAQTMAFMFTTAAVVAMLHGHSTISCLMYALAVGCRPFTVFLGPVLLMLYIRRVRKQELPVKKAVLKLIPGLAVGLAIAAAYGVYNYIRFDNPLEFGHNYLPEFSTEGGMQFSLKHVGKNVKTFLFGLPFKIEDNTLVAQKFGSSMFISCPIFICWLVWVVKDAVLRRMTPEKIMIVAMWCANLFCLLMHRTMGGLQFGARYTTELIPMCFAYFMLCPERKKMRCWESALMALGLALNMIGVCLVHI